MTPELIAGFAFGCIFIATLLVIAVAIPEPTSQQMFIFRVVIALAAGGIGAVIPGFLDINGKALEITIRAGGALACFVIVYLLNPPSLAAKSPPPQIKPPVRRAVPEHKVEEKPAKEGGDSK